MNMLTTPRPTPLHSRKQAEYEFIVVMIEIADEVVNQAHHASIKISESKICISSDKNEWWLADTGATSNITYMQ